MQRRLKNSFPGEAEFLIDKEISGIIGGGESCNSERHRRMLRIMRDIIENELTERQRLMIGLYYFKGMNIPKIAEMLGVNRSTVSRTISPNTLFI